MTIVGPCSEIPPGRLILILLLDPAKPARLRLEMYSLGLFGNFPPK